MVLHKVKNKYSPTLMSCRIKTG